MIDDEDDDYAFFSFRDCPTLENVFGPCLTPKDRAMRDAIFGSTEEEYAKIVEEEGSKRFPIPRAHLQDSSNHSELKKPAIWEYCSSGDLPVDSETSLRTNPFRPQERGGNVSSHISLTDLQNAHNALSAANYWGFGFNCYVDLGWQMMGFTEEGIEKAFHRFTNALNGWSRRTTGRSVLFLFVFERSKERGVHCHGMLHIPSAQRIPFKAWFERYGQSISSRPYSKRVWRVRSRGNTSEAHQLIRFTYMMKGVDPNTQAGVFAPNRAAFPVPISRLLKMTKGYRPSGHLSLKRVRFSRSLSPAFLEQHGFRTELNVKAGTGFETFYHFGHCSFIDKSDEWMRRELEDVAL